MDKINEFSVVKAMVNYDRWGGDPEEVYKDWLWCSKVGVVRVNDYREAKSHLMHNIDPTGLESEFYVEIRKRLESMRDKYGERSLIYNTLLRACSIAQYSLKQVQEMRLKEKNLPPAFDSSKRAKRDRSKLETRARLENYIKKSSSVFLSDLRSLFLKEMKRLERREMKAYTLNNGTTTSIQWSTYNINDITSIVYIPEDLLDKKEFITLCSYFKCLNNLSDLVYIQIPQCERYSTSGGDHMEIPDKDGKRREVYRMYPWIQTVSKAIHEFLDHIARELEGNYTYKHRDWLHNIVENNWHRTKVIVGTDMTKYSDTLDRSFIIFILENMGIPKDVCEAIDWLYGQDIFDPLLVEYHRGTEATFQGQYGDFPMITIANLIIQDFIYHELDQPKCEGYNAAVGDDTGMIFDRYDPRIEEVIVESYGSVGVRINRKKTGMLRNGVGKIDFVKLELDGQGIIPFLNMRTIHNSNVDSFVREVFELESSSEDQKFKLLEDIFGAMQADRLRDLSIINGGINDRPINEKDINFYVSRTEKLQKLMGYTPDDTANILEAQQKYLKTMDYDEHYLCETAYIGYLSKEDLESDKSLEELDEKIKINILAMSSLGLINGKSRNYMSWLGKVPSELKKEWRKRDSDPTKDLSMSEMWEEISAYDTYAAKRKQDQKRNKMKISVLLPIMNGMYDNINTMRLPDDCFDIGKEFETLENYKEAVVPYKAKKNTEILKKRLAGVCTFYTIEAFGITYHYCRYTENGKKQDRRLYSVDVRSKYSMLEEKVFNGWKEGPLKGVDLTYEDFLQSWENADRVSWNKLPFNENKAVYKK